MKKGKKYFVTDTTIFFTHKNFTRQCILMIMHYIHLPFTVFIIYSVVLPFPFFQLKSNKQIIFVMKYGFILYETDKHVSLGISFLRQIFLWFSIYSENSIYLHKNAKRHTMILHLPTCYLFHIKCIHARRCENISINI